MKLQGIFPPIATPFNHEGDLWEIKVRHNVEKWNQTGLAGYVVCGSTGESVYLTAEEKCLLWKWVAEYAAPAKILIAGTGVESVGAVGAVPALAKAAPYATISIWEAHRTREAAAAFDWQNRILRAAQLVTTKYGVPGLKYAMDLNGYYGGPPRLPLIPVTPEARQ